jgi:hypothetical protein
MWFTHLSIMTTFSHSSRGIEITAIKVSKTWRSGGLWLLWVCLDFIHVALSALCGFRVEGSGLRAFGC